MNRRTVAAIILIASAVFAGVKGLNPRTANGMVACWNQYGSSIDALSQRYQVSQSLVLALVYWESSCNINAARFEPHVYRWPAVIKASKGDDVERRFLSTSFGLGQVLGITARETLGYTGGREEFKFRSLEYGIRYLTSKKQQWGNWDDALRNYNGGNGAVLNHRRGRPNKKVEDYVRGVKALQEKYGKRIVSEWLKQAKEL